jgi:peptide/nickel transport system ATP-binding protein
MTTPLLDLRHVTKRFVHQPNIGDRLAALFGAGRKTAVVQAVTDVSLSVERGEVVGLVGESGCGKSTLGRIVAGIHLPTAGDVRFDGTAVARPAGRRVAKLTTRVQMIHQDPFASLNPRQRVGDIIAEGPVVHGLTRQPGTMVADLLARVGLDPAYARRFPHQFSGGQRQRIAIARALAMQPDLLVLDEPVASLDVSIQAQVLNLFMALRHDYHLTAIFISHDLGVVRHVADRVAIMYLGRIVETAPTARLYAGPLHPYTRALLDSVARIGVGRRAFQPIAGELPSPLDPPAGCGFHPRCPLAGPRCRAEVPTLKSGDHGGLVACHLLDGGVH